MKNSEKIFRNILIGLSKMVVINNDSDYYKGWNDAISFVLDGVENETGVRYTDIPEDMRNSKDMYRTKLKYSNFSSGKNVDIRYCKNEGFWEVVKHGTNDSLYMGTYKSIRDRFISMNKEGYKDESE